VQGFHCPLCLAVKGVALGDKLRQMRRPSSLLLILQQSRPQLAHVCLQQLIIFSKDSGFAFSCFLSVNSLVNKRSGLLYFVEVLFVFSGQFFHLTGHLHQSSVFHLQFLLYFSYSLKHEVLLVANRGWPAFQSHCSGVKPSIERFGISIVVNILAQY